jgi:hypothetical protein
LTTGSVLSSQEVENAFAGLADAGIPMELRRTFRVQNKEYWSFRIVMT